MRHESALHTPSNNKFESYALTTLEIQRIPSDGEHTPHLTFVDSHDTL